ncbi:hypothetical protein [Aliagarivorans taiwanensis]|uniref:hypothetical protein n=1 Tax=Aliagarivorans taiwanensis TaxID=561966 RepID=UPI000417776D|nr:hypothetical protein [Aliagarivorans taiwanensis]
MKTLFKTSLVALAVTGSFAASAANLTAYPAPIKFSSEAAEVGLTYAGNIAFDTIVSAEHAAGSQIVLTYSENVDLTGVAGGNCGTPNEGVFFCGPDGTGTANDDIEFDVGNGTFTFDSVVVDATARTLTFNVNLGNPVIPNSAFRTTILGTSPAIVNGQSTVAYASNLAGTPIETGTGVLTSEASQYSFVVTQELNNRVERVNQLTFVNGSAEEEAVTATKTDIAKFSFTDSAADFDVAVAPVDSTGTVMVRGSLDAGGALNSAEYVTTGATWTANVDVIENTKLVGFNITAPDMDVTPANVLTYVFAGGAGETIPLSTFAVTAEVAYSNGAGTNGTKTLSQDTSLGEWALDASVVNVPYLPVGYETISSNVEYSNHGSASAEVAITAFDQAGNQYSGDLADAPAKTVTKYSEDDIMAALGITESTKLNITFISDADEENVSIVPYYRTGDSRVQSINDQYKK